MLTEAGEVKWVSSTRGFFGLQFAKNGVSHFDTVKHIVPLFQNDSANKQVR
jgi:hypothetical protein